jgi:S-adenosyl-L-methionine hydrolase (adenosine-forming)
LSAVAFRSDVSQHPGVSIVTLLTDFGTRDWFVPSMKGVILSIAPRANVVDLTHDIPPQDVHAGAFVLAAAAPTFPKGTIHVAVVDPGVGSRRRAVAVRTRMFTFVGPDNGLLSLAVPQEEVREIRTLENAHLFRQPVSRTFHGRDIFAPVAAHLVRGVKFASLGPKLESIQKLATKEPRRTRGSVQGEIIYIDHFGNLITNIPAAEIDKRCVVQAGTQHVRGIASGYSQAGRGKPVAVVNSLNLLEIGVRGGNAAKMLNGKVGTQVVVISDQ